MKETFSEEKLVSLIPQINDIKDSELKRKTVEAWKLAYEAGNFDDLATARFNKFCDYVTLCKHTRSVTAMSVMLGKNLAETYSYEIDFDRLICVAVLHDISKLLECCVEDGAYKQTEIGASYQHGFFSTYYALQAGMPHPIAAAILTHTHQTHTLPTSLEGIIVTYADLADADAHRFMLGKPLHVADLH